MGYMLHCCCVLLLSSVLPHSPEDTVSSPRGQLRKTCWLREKDVSIVHRSVAGFVGKSRLLTCSPDSYFAMCYKSQIKTVAPLSFIVPLELHMSLKGVKVALDTCPPSPPIYIDR